MKQHVFSYLRKMRIKSLAIFGPIALAFLIGLTSCGTNPSLTSVTPIYQGMTIERPLATLSHKLEANGDSSEAGTSEGDVIIDEGDVSEDEIEVDIEDIVEIDVETTDSVEYFVVKNETFRIALNIYNPSQFEILSFTINGYKYANNMFAPGSNLTKVLVEVTASDESGIFDYTVDAIKYVDGTDIKDVRMDGEKTIKTAIRYDEEPSVQVVSQSVGTKSLSLNLFASDPNGLIGDNLFKFYLSNGLEIVFEKDLVKGANQIELNNLIVNKAYQYAVKAVYDVYDGNGLLEKTLVKEEYTTLNGVMIDNVEVGQEEVSFFIRTIEASATIDSITLHEVTEGYPQVAATDIDNLYFGNLLSNHDYYLAVKFSYTTGEKVESDIEVIRVKTLTKATPTIAFSSVQSETESLSFALAISDLDAVGEVTSVKLLKAGVKVGELTYVEGTNTFSGLLSNNDYTIEVKYTYNLNDGVGNQVITITREVRTLTKATPEVTIFDVSSTQTSVSFNIDVVDGHNVGSISKVELYKGLTLIDTYPFIEAEWPDMFVFENLLSNNLYTIRVTYAYDLNDGTGPQTLVTNYDQPTLADDITITDISILNNSYPKVGEEIHIRVLVNNPDNIVIRSFFVNGKEISVVGGNITTSAIIKFIPSDFIGGEYQVQITSISYASFGVKLFQNISSEYNDSILVLGNIGIVSISEADGKDYFVAYRDNYLTIILDNPTGYEISSLVLTHNGNDVSYVSSEIETINKDLIKVRNKGSNTISQWSTHSIKSITYGLIGSEYTTKTVSNVNCTTFMAISDSVREVTTIQEFNNLEDGYVYQLQNDINAIGYKWVPYDFNGLIYGNGFSVSNLAIVIENESTDSQYVGLFSSLKGMVSDLNLIDVYISVKTNGHAVVGGIVGYMSSGQIRDTRVSGLISVNSSSSNVGGVGGSIDISRRNTMNGIITVNHESGTTTGGIVGSGNIIIESVMTGEIKVNGNGTTSVGGISGSAGTVSNNYFSGDINVSEGSWVSFGGISGFAASANQNVMNGKLTVINNYSSSYLNLGGIIGFINGMVYENEMAGVFTVSTNSSLVTNFIGGIVGFGNGSTFLNNRMSGAMFVSNRSAADIGGIIGNAQNTTISSNLFIGTINSDNTNSSIYIGGIVGSGFNNIITANLMAGEVSSFSTNGNTIIRAIGGNNNSVNKNYFVDGTSLTINGVLLAVSDIEVAPLEEVNSQTFYELTLNWESAIWNWCDLDFQNGVYPTLKFLI